MNQFVEARARGDGSAAVQWLEQMLQASQEQPRILVELAEAQFDARRYEEAHATAERIRAIEPDSSLVDFILGKAKLKIGQIDEGRRLLQSALDRGFNPEVTNYYLASSYQTEGNLATALALYESVVDANPVNAFALVEIGTILHQTGKTEQAEPYFRQVIQLNPALAKSRLGTGN